MPDANEPIRQGEQRPYYGSATTESGTLTVSGTPTATLYDARHEVVAGFEGVNVTGYDAGAAATVRAWLNLATEDLDPGSYLLVFLITAAGSDGITRKFRPSVGITVEPATGAAPAPRLYPTAGDLEALLTSHGFTLSAALQAQLAGAIAAAVGDFEGAVQRVMLAPEDDATRRYDPPRTWRENGARLFLGRDLAAATSVVYQPTGASAETLVEGTDYELEPYDAPDQGKPYSSILFFRRWTAPPAPSLRGAVRVTGRWGYATSVPQDAWEAILARGAWRVFPQLAQSSTGGLLGWKEKDRSEDYGVQTWERLRDGWAAQYEAVVAKYFRWDLT